MEKNLNKVRTSNTKYLVFDNKEQRVKFIQLYKDLFVPYSKNGFRFSRNKNDESKCKQLLEGYELLTWGTETLDKDRYYLAVNMTATDFNKIKKFLHLKKNICDRMHGRTYWSLE